MELLNLAHFRKEGSAPSECPLPPPRRHSCNSRRGGTTPRARLVLLVFGLLCSSLLAQDIRAQNSIEVNSFENTDSILEYLESSLKPGDVVAILSNGGFDNIHVRLLDRLNETEVPV